MVIQAQEYVVRQPGGDLLGDTVTLDDKKILQRDLYEGILGKTSAFLRNLFEEHRVEIESTLAILKKATGSRFAGAFASDNEIAVQLIRAPYLMRTTGATETPTATWSFAFASGADNFIGYATDNATAINIDKRLALCILGVQFTGNVGSVVDEVLWTHGNVNFPSQVIRHAWTGDNDFGVRAVGLRPVIVGPKDTLLAAVHTIAAQTNELVVLGVAFAKGDLARTAAASITTVQT